jgi:hypothetical protein
VTLVRAWSLDGRQWGIHGWWSMEERTKKTLIEVVRRAKRLEANPHVQRRQTEAHSLIASGKRGQFPLYTQTGVPRDEERDSLILHLRLFVQNSEVSSFHNLGEVTKDRGISDRWKAGYRESSAALNRYLDSHPLAIISSGDAFIRTNRRVMELFLYGMYAHADADKRDELKQWEESAAFWPLLCFCFDDVLEVLLEAVFHIASLSEEELATLSTPEPPPGD